ncbi:MAG: GGDEF domain-containing protein [Nitrospiraceae bacterium]|nr:MAG: GGDEF domain-containing protein [Nitrospiraceae bacterium]
MTEENKDNRSTLSEGYSFDKEELRESMGWLIKLRWIGILSVLVGTHVIREVAFMSFSLIPVYIILGFAASYNMYFRWEVKFPGSNLKKLALLQIFLDQITLALAVYFSGGCDSPFIYFFIFHIVISGIILPWKFTFAFGGLAIFFPASVMGLKYLGLLPHYGIFKNEPMIFTDLTVMGSYGIVFISTVFLTAYFVTYLSRKLYNKHEEIRRLYTLSERLRSSIRLKEVIEIIEKELCGFASACSCIYMPLDKEKRVLIFKNNSEEINIPLLDSNAFSAAIMKGSAMTIDHRTLTSGYEASVLNALGIKRALVLPIMAASLRPCYEYFSCTDAECAAYGKEAGKCWQIASTHCKGRVMRNIIEKLDACLACELFTPVGLYVLDISKEHMPLEEFDINACMRLLDASGLAVSNALLYEKTMELSKTDGLTGLKNHREFKDAFNAEILRAKRYQRPCSLLMMDIDYFKHYNDTNGHPQGDVLLKKLAELIRENLKDTDVVARYGGEEFAVLLLETPKDQAESIAERMRNMIEWCRFPKEETQPDGKLTVSIGLSSFPDDGDSAEGILRAADEALYEAKRAGRNRVISA